MCCDAPSAPPVDPRQYDALDKQNSTADKMVNHTIENDQWNRERTDRLDAEQKPLIDQYYNMQKKQEARSDEQYDYYMKTGRPMIDSMMNDAKGWDSEDNLNKMRAQAASDVEQAFSGQRASTARAMARMGVNPNSGKFAANAGGLDASAALAKVSTGNAMSENRRAQGVGMRTQAANVANGFQATSMGLSNSGMNAGNAAVTTGNTGLANSLASQQAYNQGMSGAGGMYGGVANGYGNIYGQQLAGAQFNSQNSLGAGLGQLAGMGLQAWGIKTMSDRRLKTDIKRVGTTDGGLPVYTFKYVWDLDTTVMGVMADEMEQVHPEAVQVTESGYKCVDYSYVE